MASDVIRVYDDAGNMIETHEHHAKAKDSRPHAYACMRTCKGFMQQVSAISATTLASSREVFAPPGMAAKGGHEPPVSWVFAASSWTGYSLS
jgi:hypothetical protein